MTANREPELAPPGAGLPAVELFIGRILFGLRRWTATRDSVNAQFEKEREAIRALVAGCDPESAARRVLIDRARGLEDSSRHWSVWMTLDHLRIVNRAMTGIIQDLTQGRIPEGAASTADVKPSPDVNVSVVADYEQSCDALLAAVAAAPNLMTTLRFAHPWFGPLNAAGWHALASAHMGIHLEQLVRILEGLRAARH
ncbi:MAG: DinB family protein [Verrucomicrobiales bacterium]